MVYILEKLLLNQKASSSQQCKSYFEAVTHSSRIQQAVNYKNCFSKGSQILSLELVWSLWNTQVMQYGLTVTSEISMSKICHQLHHTNCGATSYEVRKLGYPESLKCRKLWTFLYIAKRAHWIILTEQFVQSYWHSGCSRQTVRRLLFLWIQYSDLVHINNKILISLFNWKSQNPSCVHLQLVRYVVGCLHALLTAWAYKHIKQLWVTESKLLLFPTAHETSEFAFCEYLGLSNSLESKERWIEGGSLSEKKKKKNHLTVQNTIYPSPNYNWLWRTHFAHEHAGDI